MTVFIRLAVLLFYLLSPLIAAAAEPNYPALTGRIVDNSSLLDAEVFSRIEQKLRAHEEKTSDQVVVATLPSLQGYPIEDYGYQLGRTWGVGEKDKDTGAILLVAPNERKVRIEVGYGLEPVLTDALSSVIIQSAILPKFRDGDMQGGIGRIRMPTQNLNHFTAATGPAIVRGEKLPADLKGDFLFTEPVGRLIRRA